MKPIRLEQSTTNDPESPMSIPHVVNRVLKGLETSFLQVYVRMHILIHISLIPKGLITHPISRHNFAFMIQISPGFRCSVASLIFLSKPISRNPLYLKALQLPLTRSPADVSNMRRVQLSHGVYNRGCSCRADFIGGCKYGQCLRVLKLIHRYSEIPDVLRVSLELDEEHDTSSYCTRLFASGKFIENHLEGDVVIFYFLF